MTKNIHARIPKEYYDTIRYISHTTNTPITTIIFNWIKERIDKEHSQILELFRGNK
jgi:hypothetical protein